MTSVSALAGTVGRLIRGPLPVPPTPLRPRQLRVEMLIVLAAGLGASAVYSILSILQRLASREPLNQQASQLNVSRAAQGWLDLAYQIADITFALVPVFLVIHLLGREMKSPTRYLGIDLSRPRFDLTLGAVLAAAIGIPGLLLYLGARAVGANTVVVAANLAEHWWSVPILIASAIQNAALEEIVMIGYLYTRATQAGWALPRIIVVSAVIRGCYHLYQGFGGFAGNIVMGLILGLVYLRTRRVMPLIITHAILDIVAFVGYTLLVDHIGWLS